MNKFLNGLTWGSIVSLLLLAIGMAAIRYALYMAAGLIVIGLTWLAFRTIRRWWQGRRLTKVECRKATNV